MLWRGVVHSRVWMIFAVSSTNRDSVLDAPFEIDLESGLLKFPQVPLTLAPKQSLALFLATDVGARAQEWGSNDGWQRYRIRQHLGDGGVLGISLFFFNACLAKIRFGYLPECERDWSDWSKERELARADTYKRGIVCQLGRRGRFPWGFADAGYDDKAACAILFVNYG